MSVCDVGIVVGNDCAGGLVVIADIILEMLVFYRTNFFSKSLNMITSCTFF